MGGSSDDDDNSDMEAKEAQLEAQQEGQTKQLEQDRILALKRRRTATGLGTDMLGNSSKGTLG